MKQTILKWTMVLALVLLPATVSFAGGRYDRGDRYRGGGHHHHHHHHKSHSSWGLSFGFGSSSWYGDYSYARIGYGSYAKPYYSNRYYYSAPAYYPPVYYSAPPVYCAPPVVYSAPPAYYYNYGPPVVRHYTSARYYYSR